MDAAETQDLDVFLTSVESKLRAPFSSLEIARAISAAPSPIHIFGNDFPSLGANGKGDSIALVGGTSGCRAKRRNGCRLDEPIDASARQDVV